MLNNTRAWAEINLDDLAFNIRAVRRAVKEGTHVIGVVKADAYGHGAPETSRVLLENGADMLAVSQLDEALQLRFCGIDAPIVILSDAEPERADELIRYGISQAVFSRKMAEALSAAGQKLGISVKLHIKLDTGMGRVGFRAEEPETVDKILEISRLPGVEIEGIFTHFAVADEEDGEEYTRKQFGLFKGVCDRLEAEGLKIPLRHAANSAAIFRFPEMQLDAVRAGIILYGMYPSEYMKKFMNGSGDGTELRPAMMFKAKVTAVKTVPAGTYLSYGCTYCTDSERIIATVPAGYADGYSRSLGGKAQMLIHGYRAPVRGRICMDQCMVDVTDICRETGEVKPGDEAVLFGSQGTETVSPEELAAIEETINYEVVCAPSKRIPRRFIKDGKVVSVSNTLLGGFRPEII